MYYVVEMDTRLTSKFIYFRSQPAGLDESLWMTGERFLAQPAHMTLVAEDEEPTAFSDMLLMRVDLHVYSPKMVATLDSVGANNIEYFPITLVDKKRAVTREDYKVANIVGNIACLDVDNSAVDTFDDGIGYSSVEEFNLLEDRIQPLPGMKSAPLIFRLAEFPYHVIAHESLKVACEDADITGARFIRTQDFG